MLAGPMPSGCEDWTKVAVIDEYANRLGIRLDCDFYETDWETQLTLMMAGDELGRFCRLNSFFKRCLCPDRLLTNADYFIDKMSDATYDRKNIIRICTCCMQSIWRMGFLKSGKNEKEVLEHAQGLSYSVGGTAV